MLKEKYQNTKYKSHLFLYFLVLSLVVTLHISGVHELKYERGNIKNPVSTVHPSTVPACISFSFLKFPIFHSPEITSVVPWEPELKVSLGVELSARVERMRCTHSDHIYILLQWSPSPQSCCAASIWVKSVLLQNNKWKNNTIHGLRSQEQIWLSR